jgi:hypothetical protein
VPDRRIVLRGELRLPDGESHVWLGVREHGDRLEQLRGMRADLHGWDDLLVKRLQVPERCDDLQRLVRQPLDRQLQLRHVRARLWTEHLHEWRLLRVRDDQLRRDVRRAHHHLELRLLRQRVRPRAKLHGRELRLYGERDGLLQRVRGHVDGPGELRRVQQPLPHWRKMFELRVQLSGRDDELLGRVRQPADRYQPLRRVWNALRGDRVYVHQWTLPLPSRRVLVRQFLLRQPADEQHRLWFLRNALPGGDAQLRLGRLLALRPTARSLVRHGSSAWLLDAICHGVDAQHSDPTPSRSTGWAVA